MITKFKLLKNELEIENEANLERIVFNFIRLLLNDDTTYSKNFKTDNEPKTKRQSSL